MCCVCINPAPLYDRVPNVFLKMAEGRRIRGAGRTEMEPEKKTTDRVSRIANNIVLGEV